MTLPTFIANIWVLPAALPYAAIAGYDFWLHETDRCVPRLERYLHAATISGVVSFLILATLGMNVAAAIVLGIFLVTAILDEVGYHRSLAQKEKRIHTAGGVAMAFCIGCWLWTI